MTDQLLDMGAQAERTALAWQRTGLSATAVGVLLEQTYPASHPLPPWPGILLMATGAVVAAVVAPLHYVRVLRAVRAGATPVSSGIVPGMVLVVLVVVAGAAAALALG